MLVQNRYLAGADVFIVRIVRHNIGDSFWVLVVCSIYIMLFLHNGLMLFCCIVVILRLHCLRALGGVSEFLATKTVVSAQAFDEYANTSHFVPWRSDHVRPRCPLHVASTAMIRFSISGVVTGRMFPSPLPSHLLRQIPALLQAKSVSRCKS